MKEIKFENARKKFKKIKGAFSNSEFKDQIKEFKEALEILIQRYNTSNWENRFVVGGALEILFCALLNSMGFKAKWLKEARYDLGIDGIKFSLKSNFVSSGDIRLVNILGNEKVSWKEPTIFFISELGICYADPFMKLKTRHTNDALVINVGEIENLIKKKPDLCIIFPIPKKGKNSQEIKTASYDVAKSILENIRSKYLINYLP